MLTYAYERVSTTGQKLERQDIAIKSFRPDIPDINIFRDKATGKNFDREQYNAMKIILEHVVKANQSGEMVEIIVEELDRLGRNADGIKKELMWFKDHNIIVRILEIPTTLAAVDENNQWVMEMVTNVLIEVYAQLAQAELEKRAKRQAEGIEVAKAKGVKFGRPPIKIEEEKFEEVIAAWRSGKITAVHAQKELGVKPNTFYRRVREFEKGGES